MAAKRKRIPRYSKVQINGHEYYKTDIEDADGKRVILYGKTREEVYDKEMAALEQIDNATFRRKSPTVAEYCEKWLLMQSVHIRATTLIDYTSKVRRHIIKELGEKRMADVTLDDIQVALVPVSKKSASVYKSVVILYKSIFRAAKESHVIDTNPTIYLEAKGGGVPQEERQALTDEQVERLLDAIRGLPPYVFVMIGLYAGLRREEILALQWDVVADRNGNPLSSSQFQRVWKYVTVRSTKPHNYYKYVNGQCVKCTVTPTPGSHQKNNPKLVYAIDFDVTPHQLRHTYITNLLYAGIDPKTVQYLAGHENSKTTMDIYAQVKYNKPEELLSVVNAAFAPSVGV